LRREDNSVLVKGHLDGKAGSDLGEQVKRTGAVGQAVEHLLYKHDILSSNPSATNKKKKKNLYY
jgi:hypothetical protein